MVLQHKLKLKKHLNKLLFGSHDPEKFKIPPSTSQFTKISNVWNSSQYHDFGIERFFRLFLVSSKVFFPVIYIELLTRNLPTHSKKIYGEFYVIFKTLVPFIILFYGLWDHYWLYVINIYLLIETFLYVFNKIFLPEHNYKALANRSMILLFFNFFEVIASFGVIYAAGNYLNQPVSTWIDALYFSFITGATIGYGDFYPINETGKILVIVQVMSTISFLFLFFNFFAPRSQDINRGLNSGTE